MLKGNSMEEVLLSCVFRVTAMVQEYCAFHCGGAWGKVLSLHI